MRKGLVQCLYHFALLVDSEIMSYGFLLRLNLEYLPMKFSIGYFA